MIAYQCKVLKRNWMWGVPLLGRVITSNIRKSTTRIFRAIFTIHCRRGAFFVGWWMWIWRSIASESNCAIIWEFPSEGRLVRGHLAGNRCTRVDGGGRKYIGMFSLQSTRSRQTRLRHATRWNSEPVIQSVIPVEEHGQVSYLRRIIL